MREVGKNELESDVILEEISTGKKIPTVLHVSNAMSYVEEKEFPIDLSVFSITINGKKYKHTLTLMQHAPGIYKVNWYHEIRIFDNKLQQDGYRIICNGTSKEVVLYKHPKRAWRIETSDSVCPLEYSEWNEHYGGDLHTQHFP